ncbi:hypothetical protein CJF32_00003782 [Rutstroemia sp. NJR-2017a WRK4]|nr:hypothetical protein CJF32_00003782 [Rutstroemia sp. NJR-2017a WRK4]
MTKTLELRTFLRKEVSKNILQLPTRRKRVRPHSPSAVSTDPQKSISRDNEEDLETPVEKFIHADISPPPNKLRLAKPKSETRLRIDELQAQLLEIIAKSHESSDSRREAARERERLIREIEVLEVQERVRRWNSLRGTLPEPISQGEKKHIQKERHRVQKAQEPKRPRIVDADLDLDPDGETRHQLGISLKRRKIEYTGKWETAVRPQWPELRYKRYGRERVGGLVLAGASEEQRGWLGRWVRSGVGKGM